MSKTLRKQLRTLSENGVPFSLEICIHRPTPKILEDLLAAFPDTKKYGPIESPFGVFCTYESGYLKLFSYEQNDIPIAGSCSYGTQNTVYDVDAFVDGFEFAQEYFGADPLGPDASFNLSIMTRTDEQVEFSKNLFATSETKYRESNTEDGTQVVRWFEVLNQGHGRVYIFLP